MKRKNKTTLLKKSVGGKEVRVKEIALFLIVVLVVSIVGFGEGVGAQATTRPVSGNIVAVTKFSDGGCAIEVGSENQIEERGFRVLKEIGSVWDSDVAIQLDKSTKAGERKYIEQACGEGNNALAFADQISKNPNKFKGSVEFNGESPVEYKDFEFDTDKELQFDWFGKIEGNGKIDTDPNNPNIKTLNLERGTASIKDFGEIKGKADYIQDRSDDGIDVLELKKDASFELDNKFDKVKGRLHNFGEGKWSFDYTKKDNFFEVDGTGLVNIKGDKESAMVKFDDFKANFNNDGTYVGDFKAKVNSQWLKDNKIALQELKLNDGKYYLPQNAELSTNFDDKGIINNIKVKASDGQVNGFGYYDGKNKINTPGISVNKGDTVTIQRTFEEKKGNFYKIFSEKGGAFYKPDAKGIVQYHLPRENNAFIVRNIGGDKTGSFALGDTDIMARLNNGQDIIIKKAASPIVGQEIQLIPSSDNIKNINGPALKFDVEGGQIRLTTRGIQSANVVGSNGQDLGKLVGGELTMPRQITASDLQQIGNINDKGKLVGYKFDSNSNKWVGLNEKITKGNVAKEALNNGPLSPGGTPRTPGGSTEKSGNGLTWLLVIGGVGAVAAYAFSKSGKDKDKDKEKDVKKK